MQANKITTPVRIKMLDQEIKDTLKEVKGKDMMDNYHLIKLLNNALKSKYICVKEQALKMFNQKFYENKTTQR